MNIELDENYAKIRLNTLPPSLNHCYIQRSCKGRVLKFPTKEAKDFIDSIQIPTTYRVLEAIKGENKYVEKAWVPFDVPVEVQIKLVFTDKRLRDVDNYLKIVIDALKEKVFKDDSQIQELRIKKETGTIPSMEVLVKRYYANQKATRKCTECGSDVDEDSAIRDIKRGYICSRCF